MHRGAWWATALGAAKSQTQLSAHTHMKYEDEALGISFDNLGKQILFRNVSIHLYSIPILIKSV